MIIKNKEKLYIHVTTVGKVHFLYSHSVRILPTTMRSMFVNGFQAPRQLRWFTAGAFQNLPHTSLPLVLSI